MSFQSRTYSANRMGFGGGVGGGGGGGWPHNWCGEQVKGYCYKNGGGGVEQVLAMVKGFHKTLGGSFNVGKMFGLAIFPF